MIQLSCFLKGYVLVTFLFTTIDGQAAPDKDFPMLFDVYMAVKTPDVAVSTANAVTVSTANAVTVSTSPVSTTPLSTATISTTIASTTNAASSIASNTPIVTPDIMSTAASNTAASVSSSAPAEAAPDKDFPMLVDVFMEIKTSAGTVSTTTISATNAASSVASNNPIVTPSITSNTASNTVTSVSSSAPAAIVPGASVTTANVISSSSPITPSVPSSVAVNNAVSFSDVVINASANDLTNSNVQTAFVNPIVVNSDMVSNFVQQSCAPCPQTSNSINTPASNIYSIVTNTPPDFAINTPSTIAPNFAINTPSNNANTLGTIDASNIIFDVEPNFGNTSVPDFSLNTPSPVIFNSETYTPDNNANTLGTNGLSNIVFDVEPNFGHSSAPEFTINTPYPVVSNVVVSNVNTPAKETNGFGTNGQSNIPTYIPNNDIFFNIASDPVTNFPNLLSTRNTSPLPQINSVTPRPPVITSGGRTTCICVPPGSCRNPVPSDGSGLINVRMMFDSQPKYEMPISARENEISNGPFDFFNFENAANSPTNVQTCAFGLSRCCRQGTYQCGESYPPPPRSPKSEAGEAPYGAYPWMAALLLKPRDAFIGGGVLIDYRHIITAAHKVANVSVQNLKIRLGEWNAVRNNEPIPPIDLSASRIFIHSGFTRSNLFNDIAVVRLANPITLGVVPTIATACLTRDLRFGSNCYVSGWGKTKFSGVFSNVQKHVRVQIKTPNQCQSYLQRTILGPSFVFNSKSFICAGGESGRDACTGDGGSPLVCQIDKRWAVVGLVAWGIGCGTDNVPGVYVNVPSFLNWIQNAVNAK